MKLIKLVVAALVGLALSTIASRAQLAMNFASTPGATIQFNGTASTFQFNTSTAIGYAGSQWSIGSEDGGISAIGLFGVVTNGPFSYGPIVTPYLGLQTATVTGPSGSLAINDGAGNFLTGSVDWIQLDTYNYAGGINSDLIFNVTGLAYAGSNPDLLALVADSPAALDVTFQFSPGKMLSALTSGTGPYSTSFSGSISVVPEPMAGGCLLLGLSALVFFQRFTQKRSS